MAGVPWSAIRCGAGEVFVPNEQDNVPAAGKRKSKRGDAAQYKDDLGAGSAAPCQDHFKFPTGKDVTDTEFPLGKKVFVHAMVVPKSKQDLAAMLI